MCKFLTNTKKLIYIMYAAFLCMEIYLYCGLEVNRYVMTYKSKHPLFYVHQGLRNKTQTKAHCAAP